MGAKHPQDVMNVSGASKYDFIVACNYLIRSKTVKSPADAIRYIEDNNSNIDELIEKFIVANQKTRPAVNATEFNIPDELR